MKTMKRFIVLGVMISVLTGSLAACGNKEDTPNNANPSPTVTTTPNDNDQTNNDQNNNGQNTAGKGTVYFLNFKPEIAAHYEEIAKKYEEETGVPVKIVTAASGTYEQTLKSEIAKSEAPTVFQVNGPVGFQSWKKYCADLKDTKLFSYLNDQSLAITEDGGVYGIPYAIEGYGIIYNNEIMDRYFAMDARSTTVNSMEEVNDFTALRAVVEDMTANMEALNIEGVFASTSLSAGNQWRWQTHLANVPFNMEFMEQTEYESPILAGLGMPEITFKYHENFKNIFDLYIENSVTKKSLLGSKSVDDSMAEFALGKCAMVQNGNWAWSQISEVSGNVVKEDQIKYLPIYTGTDQDEKQGLCIGTENYFAVNSQASAENQAAAIAFLEWMFSSETGKKYVTEDLGFIAPFTTFSKEERPSDPLAREVLNWMEKEGKESIVWSFAAFPSETFKDEFGSALLEYAQGTIEWEEVVSTVNQSWAMEY